MRRFDDLGVVEFGKFAVVAGRGKHQHFLLGLFAQVNGVDQKQNAPLAGVFQQAVHNADGGIGFAGAGGHLNQGAGQIFCQRSLHVFNGG